MSKRRIAPTIPVAMITIYAWDFHGPHAEGTAQHFLRHLHEFWARNALVDCEAGLESAGPGHHAVWCKTPAAADAAIQTLRPRRRRPADPDTQP